MRNGLLFFTGLFCAVLLSWAGIVLSSHAQLGQLAPHFDENEGKAFPQGQSGAAARGQKVYDDLNCASCHTLFGEGGKVGPDLTGSNRANLEYVLSNVLEPSAVMAKEYQTSTVTLADGRVVTGIIKAQDKQTVTI